MGIDITRGISDILESRLEGAAFRNVRTLLLSDNAKIIDGKPSIDSLTLLGDSNALRKGVGIDRIGFAVFHQYLGKVM
jgi:hypothetical protein